jgi:DNA-directed RNA polymerase subunit RPC12/RpoP
MEKPLCPRCGQALTKRVRRRLWERLLTLAAIYPFRCQYCSHRFRVRQRGVRYIRSPVRLR